MPLSVHFYYDYYTERLPAYFSTCFLALRKSEFTIYRHQSLSHVEGDFCYSFETRDGSEEGRLASRRKEDNMKMEWDGDVD